MKKGLLYLLSCILGFIILLLCVRGLPGNPDRFELNNPEWKEAGPFELSPERGRFALTFSMVEDQSVYFSLPVARFVTPDLGYYNHRFVSLFAPGVSVLAIPGYILGKYFGASQFGAFATTSFFALLNAILIFQIIKRTGIVRPIALFSSGIFLFATPAFSYAATLYQHHVSVFFILLGIYSVMKFKPLISLPIIWFLWASAFIVDYPNMFLFAPIGIYALSKLFIYEKTAKNVFLGIKLPYIFTVISIFIPVLLFVWFNTVSYGEPLKLSGTVLTIRSIDENGVPNFGNDESVEDVIIDDNDNQPISYFNTRNLVNGLFIHTISLDRGVLYYAPFMFLVPFAFYFLYKKDSTLANLTIGVVVVNIILYSMWGDPWGGWAFGSRYLIPSYAMMAIALASLFDRLRLSKLMWVVALCIFLYSVTVNTLGALTSNANPPRIEAEYLSSLYKREEKYTVLRNWDNLTGAMGTKSFMYRKYFSEFIYPYEYYLSIVALIILFYTTLIVFAYPFTNEVIERQKVRKGKKK